MNQRGANAISERHIVGVNLCQLDDPTVIGLVQRIDCADFSQLFQVTHLERVSLGMPYPEVVGHITRLLEWPAHAAARARDREDVELVIGCVESEPAVVDVFRRIGVMTTEIILIDDGRSTPPWRISKSRLTSRVQNLFRESRLKILEGLPEAAALVAELHGEQPWSIGMVLAVGLVLRRAE